LSLVFSSTVYKLRLLLLEIFVDTELLLKAARP